MKVEELLEETQADLFAAQQAEAKKILARKLAEIKRTKEILAELEANLDEFKQMDVGEIDISGIRY